MGIENAGSGIGYIYVVAADGTTIIGTLDNNYENFDLARRLGITSAPISSEILATGTVTINVGAGTVTNVTVDGVSIMGAVAASGATPQIIAADLASKINGAISSPDYDAQSLDDTVYIRPKPGTGATPNGYVVAGFVTAPTTVTTTNMGGGASPSGVFDAAIGKRFFINATSSAVQYSLSGAEEITKFLAVRGVQSPVYAVSATIDTGTLTVERVSSLMAVNVDTEGAAATDDLDTIYTTGFNDNDVLIIKGVNAARVTTIKDNTGNINLSNDTDFLTGADTVNIILRYESSADRWNEITRSQVFPTYTVLRAHGIPEPNPGVTLSSMATSGTTDIEPPVSKGYYVITGSPVLIGGVIYQPQAAPATPYLDGDEIWIDYRATPTVGGNTVTLMGIALTATQAAEGRIVVHSKYRLADTTWYSYIHYKNNSKDLVDTVALATKEDGLGNPAADGYVLSSTVSGTRSWVPQAIIDTGYESIAADTSHTLTAGTSKNVLKVTGSSTTVTSANRVITLVPSASGTVNSHFRIIRDGFKIGVGFTWKVVYDATTLITETEGSITSFVYDFYWNGSAYVVVKDVNVYGGSVDSDLSAQNFNYGAEWSFALNGGAISTIALPTVLPAGTIIKADEVIIECIEALTSGGAATVAWGYSGDTIGFDSATGFGSAPYTAANLVKYGTPSAALAKVTAPTAVTITIAGAALTAGYIRIRIPCIIDNL